MFGLGAIGLAVVQGARQAKAGRIIAIDTNPKKFELARRFGATDCINPNDYDKPIKMSCWISTNGVSTIPLNASVTST